MGKRPLLYKNSFGGEIKCTTIEVEEEEALTLPDALAAFQRLAKEFLQDKNVAWAIFGDELVVEPELIG